MRTTLPTTITNEFAEETPAISDYLELTPVGGQTFRLACFECNWAGAGNAATHGFAFEKPIEWNGSSTQTMTLAIARTASFNGIGVDFGQWAIDNLLRGAAVKLWWRGGLDAEIAAALAANKLQPCFDGTVQGAEAGPQFVYLACSTEYAARSMTPLIKVSVPTFNHVPAPGATVVHNGVQRQLGGVQ
jgi:hypothetical protein